MLYTPHITVLTGPGNHSAKLTEAMKASGHCVEVFQYYPHFEHQVYNEKGELVQSRKNRFASRLAQYCWAICIRIGFLKKRNYHIYLSFVIYDRWASKNASKHSRLLWAWSQTGKKTMQKFARAQKPVVLEKPMVHVDTWSGILEKEYLEHTGNKFHPYYFCGPLRKRMRAEYTLAQTIVTLSLFTDQSFVQNGISEKKLYRVNLYADTGIFTKGGTKEKGPFRLLFVGRIDLLKGIPALLKALRHLRKQDPGMTLTLVGEVKPEVQALLEQDKENILLAGTKTPTELAHEYHKAHLLVLPSVQESFGLVMLEALACGTPVLASAHTGAPDLARYTRQVTVYELTQEQALEDHISRISQEYHQPENLPNDWPYTKARYFEQVHHLLHHHLQPTTA